MTLRPLVLFLCLAACGCPGSDTSSVTSSGSASDTKSPSLRGARGSDDGGVRPELETVKLEGGPFVMGSDGSRAGGQDCERPKTERLLPKGVLLDLHEVTNAAYAMFLASPAAKSHSFCHSEEPKDKDHTPAKATAQERTWGAVAEPFVGPERSKHPVVGVDWFDAYAFATWMGRRLPTEEEFEKAARGPDGKIYPWGDSLPRVGDEALANGHFPDGFPMTAPVGSFPKGAAPCGALDLAGNVWEWTGDPFLPYEGAPEDTPSDGELYVFRGGGWNSATAFLLRGAMRVGKPRLYRSAALGFRTVAEEGSSE